MNYIFMAIGLILLVRGSDIMVNGASKTAKILKVPAFVIGLFIVALGTSAPESAIGVVTGIKGSNLLTLGDVIGSSIMNILLIMGITSMVAPLDVDSKVAKREIPISLAVQIGLILMIVIGSNLTRIDGAALLVGLIIFMSFLIGKSWQVFKQEKADSEFEEDVFEYIEDQKVLVKGLGRVRKKGLPKALLFFLMGLAALIIGANMIVVNAVVIAENAGWSQEFIGLTIIAFGTSLPELVTCLIALYRKEEDIAVGNIIGSNILNILFVLGLSSVIHPINIGNEVYMDLGMMIIATLMILIPVLFKGILSRKTGFLFFSVYLIYIGIKVTML